MPNHCDDSYMYLNDYTAEVNDEIDNLIILLKLTNHSDYADQLFRYP